jgi:hypothetical protein
MGLALPLWLPLAALAGTLACAGASPPADAAATGDDGGADAGSADAPSDHPAQDDAAGAEQDGSSGGGDGDGDDDGHSESPADAATDADAPVSPDAPATGFQIEVPVTTVMADGVSLVPLLVRAPPGDGDAPADELTLSLSRPAAGLLRPRVLTPGGPDPHSYFTPCAADTPGCAGPVKVRLARAGTPDTILAESAELMITAGDGVNTPAPCLLGGNSLFLDGTQTQLNRIQLIRTATFSDAGSARRSVVLQVLEPGREPYQAWELRFSTVAAAQDLAIGVYSNGAGSSDGTGASMSVSGWNFMCHSSGAFQVHRLVWAGNQLEEILVSFDHPCSTRIRGCILAAVPD